METIYNTEKIKISYEVMGLLGNNVYFLSSNDENVVVDPSCKANEIIQMFNVDKISKILLTHYHFDHVGAAYELRKATEAKTYASAIDSPKIEIKQEASFPYRKVEPCKVDVKIKEGDIINIGTTSWKVIETPGHTMGSICFYSDNCGDNPVLLCGDTLFKCSCGRTDFPDSNPDEMHNSLAKLAKLPDNTLVLPGHESMTSIKNEKDYFLKDL